MVTWELIVTEQSEPARGHASVFSATTAIPNGENTPPRTRNTNTNPGGQNPPM
jgi:hypothetical protein